MQQPTPPTTTPASPVLAGAGQAVSAPGDQPIFPSESRHPVAYITYNSDYSKAENSNNPFLIPAEPLMGPVVKPPVNPVDVSLPVTPPPPFSQPRYPQVTQPDRSYISEDEKAREKRNNQTYDPAHFQPPLRGHFPPRDIEKNVIAQQYDRQTGTGWAGPYEYNPSGKARGVLRNVPPKLRKALNACIFVFLFLIAFSCGYILGAQVTCLSEYDSSSSYGRTGYLDSHLLDDLTYENLGGANGTEEAIKAADEMSAKIESAESAGGTGNEIQQMQGTVLSLNGTEAGAKVGETL